MFWYILHHSMFYYALVLWNILWCSPEYSPLPLLRLTHFIPIRKIDQNESNYTTARNWDFPSSKNKHHRKWSGNTVHIISGCFKMDGQLKGIRQSQVNKITHGLQPKISHNLRKRHRLRMKYICMFHLVLFSDQSEVFTYQFDES